jgi:hypothetical protein
VKFNNSKTSGIHPELVSYIRSATDWSLYHPTVQLNKRTHNGAGLTFEYLLKVPVNSRASADLLELDTEVKTGREESGSLLTLFTKNPPRKLRALTKQFGTDSFMEDDPNMLDRRGFYYTHTNKRDGLFKAVDSPDKLLLTHKDEEVAYWSCNQFKDPIQKMDRVCYAKTASKKINGVEHFKYNTVELYYGFKAEKFYADILSGDVIIDFRAHFDYTKMAMRDHGTAFRVDSATLAETYYEGYEFINLNDNL